MAHYIDGFAHPIPRAQLAEYQKAAEAIAAIWLEHGALSYRETTGEDLHLEGTRSFVNAVDAKADEVVLFGWVVFPSKEVRDAANAQVPQDARMAELMAPIANIFDASRMVYGGFESMISVKSGSNGE